MTTIDRKGLMATVRAQFQLDWGGIHGAAHWARVRKHALTIGRIRGADLLVVELFALLHDSCRENDDYDPLHGHRAAAFTDRLNGRFFNLSPAQLDQITEAMQGHSDGQVIEHPTIQTCWDADRLDLGRVGICPDPRFLSKEAEPLILSAYEWSVGRNNLDAYSSLSLS